MTGEIVGLRDRVAPLENGAEPQIINVLEDILARAKHGEIAAIGIISVLKNGDIGSISRNPGGCRHLLVAGCAYLQRDIMASD